MRLCTRDDLLIGSANPWSTRAHMNGGRCPSHGRGEQLSWLSRVSGIIFVPRGPMFQPRVANRHQLAPPGGECHLRCFPHRPPSRIARREDGLVALGRPRPPVGHARGRSRGSRGRPPSTRRSPGGSRPPTPGPLRPASARGGGRRPACAGQSRLGRANQVMGAWMSARLCWGAVGSPRAARLSGVAKRPGAWATARAGRGFTPPRADRPQPGPRSPAPPTRQRPPARPGWAGPSAGARPGRRSPTPHG